MQRVKRSSAVSVLPAAPGGGTPGYFALPNPGGGVPATQPGYEWYNGVQEELMAVIEDQGLTPNEGNLTQLATAIKKIFQKSASVSAAASGTVDAITANYSPAIAALSDHLFLIVRAGGANTSTAPTFTPASATITAKTIVKGHNQPLVAGDISGAGFRAELQYDLTLDKWVLLNPATGVAAPLAVATVANDGTFADNSTKAASTGWVRGAMSAIANAAGFAASFATNGYVKFPSWLGSFIIQWGTTASVTGDSTLSVTFPIAFPNAAWTITGSGNASSVSGAGINQSGFNFPSLTTSGFQVCNDSTSMSVRWIAFGN